MVSPVARLIGEELAGDPESRRLGQLVANALTDGSA
jgi:hypothetical protein